MKKKIPKKAWISALVITVIALSVWTAWGNTALELNACCIESAVIPKAFSGYRIAHVSDLHNAQMGKENERLIAMLKDARPDIIAITGDLIDSRRTDVQIALDFAKQALEIAPCYYVTGNHEARVPEYQDLKMGLQELGVTVLEDQRIMLEKEGEHITLLGVNDPSFQTNYLLGDSVSVMEQALQKLTNEEKGYMVLLSHRPELFEVYVESGVDLVLSGHAHGGQFRLPFLGGMAAPNQGLFPKYDAGLYSEQECTMVVSRGIGNSLVPFRFNNRPEVVLIELQKAE